MPTDTVSIEQFVKDNHIRMTAERADRNPNMSQFNNMDHWKVVFTRPILREGFDTWHGYKGKLGNCQYSTRMLTAYFSMGYGHKGTEPTAEEVLSCLAGDASSVENSFEEWCSDFGYESDSRTAEKTYKACEHTAKRLQRFLGSDLYDQLLYHTEPL